MDSLPSSICPLGATFLGLFGTNEYQRQPRQPQCGADRARLLARVAFDARELVRDKGSDRGHTMSRLCEGRVAIVTGAGRGIGREDARMHAPPGATVVVNDLGASTEGTGKDPSPAARAVEEIRAAGGEAIANGDDVGEWHGAKRLIDQAIETFGRLDVLVNNAGILRDR